MFHPVGTKGSVAGYLRYAVAVFPQNQCARTLILRNGCNPCLHIRNNLVAGSSESIGLAFLTEDILQKIQPLFVAV